MPIYCHLLTCNNWHFCNPKLLWKFRSTERELGNHWSVVSVPQDGRQDCISALCIIMIAIKFHWNCFVWQIAAFRPQQHTTLWLGSDAEKNFSWWYTNNPVYSLRGRTHPTRCQSWPSPPRQGFTRSSDWQVSFYEEVWSGGVKLGCIIVGRTLIRSTAGRVAALKAQFPLWYNAAIEGGRCAACRVQNWNVIRPSRVGREMIETHRDLAGARKANLWKLHWRNVKSGCQSDFLSVTLYFDFNT